MYIFDTYLYKKGESDTLHIDIYGQKFLFLIKSWKLNSQTLKTCFLNIFSKCLEESVCKAQIFCSDCEIKST